MYPMGLVVVLVLFSIGHAAAAATVIDDETSKPFQPFFVQSISDQNTLKDKNGREFSLDIVELYTDLYGSDLIARNALNSTRSDSSVGGFMEEYGGDDDDDGDADGVEKLLGIFVYRGVYEDGTVVLVSKDSPDATPNYVMINGPGGQTNFLPDGEPGTFVTIEPADYDFEELSQLFGFHEEMLPSEEEKEQEKETRRGRDGEKNKNERQLQVPSSHNYVNGDGSSAECSSFIRIPITIMFDNEFCQLYNGDLAQAISAVQMIFAAASIHYEFNLCAKLILTGLHWDTISCTSEDSKYKDIPKTPCSAYLTGIRDLLEGGERARIGLDPNSWVSFFTGEEIQGNLGCAWQPGACRTQFAYSLGYMSFLHPDISGPAFILAHELGHNFGAEHDNPSIPEPPDYVMESDTNSAQDGFSPLSQIKILDFLTNPFNTCVSAEPVVQPTQPTPFPTNRPLGFPPPTRAPFTPPTYLPTASPTTSPPITPPTFLPTPSPTLRPSSKGPSLPTGFPTRSPIQFPIPPFDVPAWFPTPPPETVPPPFDVPAWFPTPPPETAPSLKPTSFRQAPGPNCISFLSEPASTCVQNSFVMLDFICYNLKDLIKPLSDSCNAEIRVDACHEGYMVSSNLRPHNSNDGVSGAFLEEYSNDRRAAAEGHGRRLNFDSDDNDDDQLLVQNDLDCHNHCQLLQDEICFRANAFPKYDHWYTVQYTVTSLQGEQSLTKSIFVKTEESSSREACSSQPFRRCR